VLLRTHHLNLQYQNFATIFATEGKKDRDMSMVEYDFLLINHQYIFATNVNIHKISLLIKLDRDRANFCNFFAIKLLETILVNQKQFLVNKPKKVSLVKELKVSQKSTKIIRDKIIQIYACEQPLIIKFIRKSANYLS